MPPAAGAGRPRIYCSGRCRTAADRARPGNVALIAADGEGRELDREVVAEPLDPAGWADALAAVAGALAGTAAAGGWAVTTETPQAATAPLLSPDAARLRELGAG